VSASPLFKYNPQRVDPTELEAVTLGRGDLLDRLESHLRREADEAHPQHLVLVGPRGIGKTHLLTILHHRCLTDSALSQAWLPLLFPEELHDVVDLRTFYRRLLRAMRDAGDDATGGLPQVLAEVEGGGKETAPRAAAFLKDFAARGRRLLLLMDNVDRVLGVLPRQEQKALRDTLMNEPFGLVVGGSLSVFKEHAKSGEVFFHLFESLSVPPLTVQEMGRLIRVFADRYGPEGLADRLSQNPRRLEALWHITGGYPRLAIVAHEVLSHQPERATEVVEHLEAVMDDMTPYFQDRLNQLPDRERQLVDALVSGPGPLTPAELAKETGLSADQVRAQLSRLGDRGVAAPLPQTQPRRTKRYDLTERLFRSWYHWRLGGPGKRHVLLVVEILEALSTVPELRRARENMGAVGATRSLSTSAIASYQQALDVSLERLSGAVKEAVSEAYELVHSRQYDAALARLQDARDLDPDNPNVLFALGYAWNEVPLGLKPGSKQSAIEWYERALKTWTEADFPDYWATTQNNLGNAYQELPTGDRGENLQRAIACYEAALRVRTEADFPAQWAATQNNLGNAYQELPTGDRGQNLQRAIACYEGALPIARQARPWRVDGLLRRMARTRTECVQHTLLAGEVSETRRQLEAALAEAGQVADHEEALPLVLRAFQVVLSSGRPQLAGELLATAREVLPHALAERLFVVEIAVNYLTTQDPDVLDRLSPEVREAVEALLRPEDGGWDE